MFFREEIEIGLPHQFIHALQSEHISLGLAGFDKTGLGVLEINLVRRIFEQRPQQIALVGQRGLSLLAGRNVKKHPLRSHDPVVGVKDR